MRRASVLALVVPIWLVRLACAASTTQPEPKPVLARIALLGDPHVTLDPKHSQYGINFQHVIADVNASNVDFVLIAGDVTNGGDAPSEHRFMEIIKGIHAKVFCVAGNHDVGQKPLKDKPATVTAKRIEQFESIIGPEHYTADLLPNLHLIGITSSLFSSGIDPEEPQWQFLESELAKNRPGVTILMTHYPPYAVKPDEVRGYFNMEPASRARLHELLASHPHTLILSAHLHRPILHHWDGILDIGAPGIAFGIPAGVQPVGWTLVTIHPDGTAEALNKYPPIPNEPPATQP